MGLDTVNLEEQTLAMVKTAKEASRVMARATPGVKADFLRLLAARIREAAPEICAVAERDFADAVRANALDAPRRERLKVTASACSDLALACEQVAAVPDPIGATESQWQRPNGLLVGKMRIPLGVICMIYESRPLVTVDAAILALKAGNAIILKGGKEAANANALLARLMGEALRDAGLPEEAAQLVPVRDREVVRLLCRQNRYIDLMIPRGGESLVRSVAEAATMPVLMHYKGVCHAYVDEGANLDEALNIVINSKAQRPGVCNALECLLVHREEAVRFLPMLARELAPYKVQFRADAVALPLLGSNAVAATPADFGCEFLDLILAVAVVPDMDAALNHIAQYGSRHTDIICTSDYRRAMRFLQEVDASMVAVNASTRFNDGGQLGLGAEIGISTTKLHAYGPMGVNELTTSKFVVLGHGQIRG